ncbi:MAG: tetratricopeptide repeat protein [Desmonostoc vinosum HA7617-LM4]|jgi:CHAT domain-containing protein/Tfp pilus assembly protein PilF|nr:tetratricopeptide repeat protein [Desmonostoc vinosum HA7617-LM4]
MKKVKFTYILCCYLANVTRYSLTFLLGLILLADAVGARQVNTKLQIAQQSGTTQPNTKQAAAQAQQLMSEAEKLYQQGTAASRQQAIAKYEQALKIWRQIGDRNWEANTLLSIGTLYFTQNDNQKALDFFNQGLAIRRELKDRFGEAVMLSSVARALSSLGEKQKALSSYNQALLLFRAEKKPDFETKTLVSIGQIYFQLGQTQKAVDYYNQALVIERAQKNLNEQADILKDLGLIYTQLGERQKALDFYNQALELQRQTKNLTGQADVLNQISTVYFSVGEYQKALESSEQALKLQKQAQGNLSGTALALNLRNQAFTLTGIARGYNSLGEPQKAIEYYNQARSLLQKAGDRYGEAEVLNLISFVYDQLGEKQQALNSLNQALVLQRANKNRDREAFTLSLIAGIYKSFGDYQQALNSYNQALDLSRQVGERSREADTLKDIALVYRALGDYKLSIETFNQALEIFQKIGDRGREAQTLENIGTVYRTTAEYSKALEYYNQALKLEREQGDSFQEIATLISITRVYESLKDYPKAFDTANQALLLSRQQKNSLGEAGALALLGVVYQASGDYQKALDASVQATSLMRKIGNKYAEATYLGNIGKTYKSLKQPQQAIATYNQQLGLWRNLGNRTEEADTLYNLAVTERDRGNLTTALPQIQATIKIVEDTRTKVTSQELRTSYFATVQKYYQFYIDLLMQLHKKDPSKGYDALALQASERSRARGLVELLTEARVDIRKDVDPKLLAQERSLQWRIEAQEKKLSDLANKNDTQKQAIAVIEDVKNLLDQQQQLKTKIRNQNPEYAALKYPEALTLPQIQQQLDKDTLLLQYSLGEGRSYLWAITPNSFDTYELPGREQIEKVAKNLYNNYLKNPGMQGVSPEETAKAANELSKLIIAPVADKLGQKRLVIVGDDALQYIPFAALTTGKSTASPDYQPLVVNHEIITLPSASTIAILRQQIQRRAKAPKTLAILADPVFNASDERVTGKAANTTNDLDLQLQESALQRSARGVNRSNIERLQGTRNEAQEILKLVPKDRSLQAFDFDANYNWATSKQLSQYQMVHFATHGFADSNDPELSGIVLSLVDKQGKPQRGFLRLNEIFNLNFPAELVVLSACETGLGQEVQGEGLVGLTRGLMYAGAARVVVSLWSVDDEATSLLMRQFYSEMLQQGKTPAAALRAAQLQLWQQEQWRNPYSWAGFTLLGEWR